MKSISFFCTLIFLTFLACDPDNNGNGLCLIGDGKVNDYPLDLDEFDRVSLIGPINLKIKQGATQDVVLLAESEMFPHITYEVVNERLTIGFKDDIRCFQTGVGVWVNVTVPDIEEVSIFGVSIVNSDGELTLDNLDLYITGAGAITLAGTVENQTIDVTGTLELSNFSMASSTTNLSVSGQCEAELTVEDELNINVNGAATVTYRGGPVINQSGSGVITLVNVGG